MFITEQEIKALVKRDEASTAILFDGFGKVTAATAFDCNGGASVSGDSESIVAGGAGLPIANDEQEKGYVKTVGRYGSEWPS